MSEHHAVRGAFHRDAVTGGYSDVPYTERAEMKHPNVDLCLSLGAMNYWAISKRLPLLGLQTLP